jgi:serine/threonine protein kinase
MRSSENVDTDWREGDLLAGRYRLEALLGRGAYGVVYKAFDARTRVQVALKRLHVRNPEALLAFKQEFRALARVTHYNLVSLFELHAEGSDWFFSMEYVDGLTLIEHLHAGASPASLSEDLGFAQAGSDERTASLYRSPGVQETPSSLPLDVTQTLRRAEVPREGAEAALAPPAPGAPRVPSPLRDQAELRGVMAQLAEALDWLHASGKLHRDVKPRNIRVSGAGRVVLLDFGLVHEFGTSFAPFDGEHTIVGSPGYLAPEVALARPATPASDWYSFGVVLYQALTGKLPFSGQMKDVLREKVSRAPPGPGDIAEGVPPDLDSLCRALLSRAPEDRPSSRAIRDALGLGAPRERASASPRQRPFVGRRAELEALQGALTASAGGETTVVLLSGLSGMGKSALAERFLGSLGGGSWVLAGRCYERESVPYKALDGVVDALTRRLALLEPPELSPLIPQGAAALARLFPALRQLMAPGLVDASVPTDERQGLRAAARAMRQLLASVGQQRQVVIAIDDMQWGDEDSLSLLGELLRGPDAPPLLLLAMYRSDEAETSPFLRKLLGPEGPVSSAQRVVRVPVEPLGDADARGLADALGMSGHADAVAREAHGCPLFINELAHHALADDGAREGRLAMDDAIRARAAQLPEAARRYLEVVAIAGHPLPDTVLRTAAGLQEMDPRDRQRLEQESLVRARSGAGGEKVEPWHDRIRESMVAGLDPDRRREYHLRLAEAIESAGLQDAALLADHFLQGGAPQRAQPHAVGAGDHAARALAFDRAARYYRTALELADAPELRVKLAHALRNAGRGAEAAQAYLAAAERAGPHEALSLRIQATEQFLFTGEYAIGEAIIREVLAGVGLAAKTGNSMVSLGAFAVGAMRLRWRGLDFQERAESSVSPDVLRKLDLLRSASLGLSMANTLEAQALQKRHLLLALETGEPRRLLLALSIELAFSGLEGGRDEGRSDALRRHTQAVAERVEDPHGHAFALMANGAVHWLRGRWPQAYECASVSYRRLREECTGVTWELDTAQFLALHMAVNMGHWRELRAQFPSLLADAVERGDLYLETQLRTRLSWLTRLMEDDPARAREDVGMALRRWTAQGFHIVHLWELQGQVHVHLYEERGAEALEVLRERLWPLRKSMLLLGQYYRALFHDTRGRAWLVTARGLTERSPAWNKALAMATRDGERLLREDMPYTDAHGHAVLGGVAALRGETQRARALWSQAAREFDETSMLLHAAAVRLRLGLLVGGEEGQALVAQATATMKAEEIVQPERMARMLCP